MMIWLQKQRRWANWRVMNNTCKGSKTSRMLMPTTRTKILSWSLPLIIGWSITRGSTLMIIWSVAPTPQTTWLTIWLITLLIYRKSRSIRVMGRGKTHSREECCLLSTRAWKISLIPFLKVSSFRKKQERQKLEGDEAAWSSMRSLLIWKTSTSSVITKSTRSQNPSSSLARIQILFSGIALSR